MGFLSFSLENPNEVVNLYLGGKQSVLVCDVVLYTIEQSCCSCCVLCLSFTCNTTFPQLHVLLQLSMNKINVTMVLNLLLCVSGTSLEK